MNYLKITSAILSTIIVFGCKSIKSTAAIEVDNRNRSQVAINKEQRIQLQEILVTKLMLTSDQEVKYRAISKSYENEINEARQSNNSNRNQIASIRENWNEEIKSILTSEQYELYLSERKEHKGNRKQRR